MQRPEMRSYFADRKPEYNRNITNHERNSEVSLFLYLFFFSLFIFPRNDHLRSFFNSHIEESLVEYSEDNLLIVSLQYH